MNAAEAPLKQTPLNAAHRALGAKMVPFGGWDMPVQYRGILEEHRAVRSPAGLFDVSHMGEVEFRGAGALAALQRLTSNDVSRLQIGQVQYSALTTEAGTFVDDLTVYRLADDHYLVTLNASNIEKDVRWMREHATGVEIIDRSDETGLVAIQGPRALAILQKLTPVDLAAISYYWFARGAVLGEEALAVPDRLHGRGRLRDLPAAAARRWRCGTRSWRRASRWGSSRAVSGRGTPCAWKPRWPSTGTTSTTSTPSWRPTWAGS